MSNRPNPFEEAIRRKASGTPEPTPTPTPVAPKLSRKERKAMKKAMSPGVAVPPGAAPVVPGAAPVAPGAAPVDPRTQPLPGQGPDFFDAPPVPPKKTSKIWTILGVLVLILFLAIGGLLAYNKFLAKEDADALNPPPSVPVATGVTPESPLGLADHDYMYNPDACQVMWKTLDYAHYWRCVKGDIHLGNVVDDAPLAPQPAIEVKPFDTHRGRDDGSVYFGTSYQLTPDARVKGVYILTRGTKEPALGIFAKDPSSFTSDELKAMVNPLAKDMVPSRITSVDPRYDGLVGVAFKPIEYCGETDEQCKAFYAGPGQDSSKIPHMGTEKIDSPDVVIPKSAPVSDSDDSSPVAPPTF